MRTIKLLHCKYSADHHQHLYLDTSAMILTAVLFGKLLESIAKGQAMKEMIGLHHLQSRMIRIQRHGEEWIPIEELNIGDIAVVLPGELISIDGKVVSGNTKVDEAFLTGEWKSMTKTTGSFVYCGSSNLTGSGKELQRASLYGKDHRKTPRVIGSHLIHEGK
jgi:Cu+-exporting ATPase